MSGTEQGKLAECCLSGHLQSGTPSGKVEEINGRQCYVSAPSNGSKAKTVLYITDIFGWEFVNARLLADEYAKQGLYVIIPDFLDGTALPHDFQQTVEPNLKQRETLTAIDKAKNTASVATTLGPFMISNREAVTKPKIDAFVEALRKDPQVGKIGAVGFCWGGRHAILLAHGQVDAAVACHPAMLGLPADIEPVTKPLSIALGDQDTLVDEAQRKQILDVLGTKLDLPKEIRVYEDQVHGFAVRGDHTSPKDHKAMDDAAKQTVEWFNKYLA